MLTDLAITDIVLIDRLNLEFGAGLSVLSGETGAGKSILLDALSLALGGRGDAGLVRQGQGKGSVTAIFNPGPERKALRALGEAHGIDLGDDLVLRRIQHSDGRTRGFVNDEPVSARLMKDIGEALVEIHGQHEGRALLEPASHLALIDAFGGLADDATNVAVAWKSLQSSNRALEDHKADIESVARDADYLSVALEELDGLAVRPGEEQALAAERQMMMQGERIAEDLVAARAALAGENGADQRLSTALTALERANARIAGLVTPALEALGRAAVEIEEGRAALDDLMSRSEAEPARLEHVEERLFAFRAAARKHGVDVEGLPGLAEKLRARLAAIEGGEERLKALAAEVAAARDGFLTFAHALSARRHAAAARLDGAVLAELPALRLENARFETSFGGLDEDSGGPWGLDRAEMLIAANPGTALGPLRKVASGGELARVMLALKVVLAGTGGAPTLIFDEIDAGVGGGVAHAVGERLARLGGETQVLVVTHSPQVAAKGATHFLIEKSPGQGNENMVTTAVTRLADPARHEEVARMLAGATITDEARAAAAKLIAGEA